jgi:lactoylglutathione lyase
LGSRDGEVTLFPETFPILLVADVQRSLRFYEDLVGGTEEFRFPDKGDPVHVGLRWELPTSGSALTPTSLPPAAPGLRRTGTCSSFGPTQRDCDAAIETLRANGVDVIQEPENQPWGERIARVLDPDGNRVVVASR